MSEDRTQYTTNREPLPAKLTISRMHSNLNQEDTIRIQVEDKTSGTSFLEIRLTPEALALALTGSGYQECTFELGGLENVGKRRELKTQMIPEPPVDDFWKWSEEQKREYLKPYEVDGWKVNNLGNFGNHHRRVGDGYQVTFVRFVEVESEQVTGPES